jgi:hypothetical protein
MNATFETLSSKYKQEILEDCKRATVTCRQKMGTRLNRRTTLISLALFATLPLLCECILQLNSHSARRPELRPPQPTLLHLRGGGKPRGAERAGKDKKYKIEDEHAEKELSDEEGGGGPESGTDKEDDDDDDSLGKNKGPKNLRREGQEYWARLGAAGAKEKRITVNVYRGMRVLPPFL